MIKKYGMLEILGDSIAKGRKTFICKCDCGTIKEIRRDAILSGVTVSCGCYGREARLRATKKHGLSRCSKTPHPLYTVWDGMLQRCSNQNHSNYYLYGGRGIKVCDEWRKNFMSFYDWATSSGYAAGLTLERMDYDKGYSPDNCRWATTAEQARNKRTNVNVEFGGKIMCLQDVANATGINRSTLHYRLKHGLPLIK